MIFEDIDPIERPRCEALDEILGRKTKLLDHGALAVLDYMGDQNAIVDSARMSYGDGTKSVSDGRGLIRYLLRNRHTSPIEMCEIRFFVKLPIFVARQWIRHRMASVNEYSARYSILKNEFYQPSIDEMKRQSTDNKQGRTLPLDTFDALHIQKFLLEDAMRAFSNYDDNLQMDLSRELARIGLPLSTYTQMVWKIDLHNLLHFLTLRADSHAQYEIRVYAEAIAEIVRRWVPDVWQAWQDYQVNAHTFSAMQMDALRTLIQSRFSGQITEIEGCSKREIGEFNKALGLLK